MSTIEVALRQRLLAAPAVTAIVAQRVTWQTRPQGAPLPALVLTLVSDIPEEAFDGDTGFTNALVQVDAYAERHETASSLMHLALAELRSPAVSNGVSMQRAFVTGVRDLGEATGETGFIVRRSADLRFFYTTT